MRSALMIGLGSFGLQMAKKLQELDHEVLAIDKSEERVNNALPFVTNAQIGDSTTPHLIESLGVRNFDLCVVAIAEDFQSSLETTALLKENGAPFVVSRATNPVHAKFLLRNGADEVVDPKLQMANLAAVRYSSESIFDYVELTPEYSIYETAVPHSWLGKTVVELAVRQKYHLNILGVKEKGRLAPMPGPNHAFREGETILILGSNKDIQKFLKIK